MTSPLLSYLASVRKSILSPAKSPSKLIVILGNTSCDLDSFISAVVLSYFYNRRPQQAANSQSKQQVYVPLLNLSAVPSSELWRLRPEFGAALRLATARKGDVEAEGKSEGTKKVLEGLLTIKDVTESNDSAVHGAFSQLSARKQNGQAAADHVKKQEVILVDHNSPAISELSDLSSRLELVGCIDHHVDESVVPSNASPRIITTGVGSCTSLIVQHLRDEKLWPAPSDQLDDDKSKLKEVAKLALAPILIDTFNLRASGDKCSDIDQDSVMFLESHFAEDADWDRESFFSAVSQSKANSLDLLTMSEILERDYKEWSETPRSLGKELNIGIPSLVKRIEWLVKKAGGPEKFVDEIYRFARETEHDLSLVGLIAKSSEDGEFKKQLGLVAFSDEAAKAVEGFEKKTKDELKLDIWTEDEDLLRIMDQKFGEGKWRLWWQGDTEKSRKQVAPALRQAVRDA